MAIPERSASKPRGGGQPIGATFEIPPVHHSPETAFRGIVHRLRAVGEKVADGLSVEALRNQAKAAVEKLQGWVSELGRARQNADQAGKTAEAAKAAAVKAREQAEQAEAKAKAAEEDKVRVRSSDVVNEAVEEAKAMRQDGKKHTRRAEEPRPNGSQKERREGRKPAPEIVAQRVAEATSLSDARAELLLRVARAPVPWKDVAIPKGSLPEAHQTGKGSWLLGGTGAFTDQADLASREGLNSAIRHLESQTPQTNKGRPVEHVAHLVLPIPHGEDGKPVREWDTITATRAARQAMLANGADPDHHDGLIFRHSKAGDGSHAPEECLHVVFSRVASSGPAEGLLHTNDHAWISSTLGALRWRLAAGVPVKDAGCTSSGNRLIREGFEKLQNGKHLYARYKPMGGKDREKELGVRLTDEGALNRLGEEGRPEDGLGVGEIWLWKGTTRDAGGLVDYLRRGA